MRKIVLSLLFVLPFLLTSCLEVVEELRLNRNGSGQYSITIDMSKLFADDFMKSMIKSSLEEQANSNLKLGQNGLPEIDTIIYFKDLPAEQKGDKPEFWNKVSSQVMMSEAKNQFLTTIRLNFDKLEDIAYLYENLNAIGQNNAQLGGLTDQGGVLPTGVIYTLAGGVLTRKSPKTEAPASGEEAEMMKMFLEGATHRVVYNLPGKVKKVSVKGAKINGQTVVTEASLIDIMDGKGNLDGTIKFK